MRRWAPLVLWCAVIFAGSSAPGSGVEPGAAETLLRKSAHVAEYGVLGLAAVRAWPAAPAASLGFCLAYAASDELHQTLVPGRRGRPLDVGLDALGAVLAHIAVMLIRRRRH